MTARAAFYLMGSKLMTSGRALLCHFNYCRYADYDNIRNVLEKSDLPIDRSSSSLEPCGGRVVLRAVSTLSDGRSQFRVSCIAPVL